MTETSFRLPRHSGLATIILLGFVALAHVVAFTLSLFGGPTRLLQSEPDLVDGLYALAVLLALLFTLPASITWIVWAVRTRKNLDALGVTGLEYSTWFPWYFVVPLLNFFVPMIAVQEMWRKGVPASGQAQAKSSKLISLWWLCFATYTLSRTVPRLVDQVLGSSFELRLVPLYHGAAVPAAVLGSAVVWRFLKRQRMQAPAEPAQASMVLASA